MRKRNSPSEISLSLISHAKIVGFSRLYCSIFDTTAGVATFGFDPPIKPGGRSVPGNYRIFLNYEVNSWMYKILF